MLSARPQWKCSRSRSAWGKRCLGQASAQIGFESRHPNADTKSKAGVSMGTLNPERPFTASSTSPSFSP